MSSTCLIECVPRDLTEICYPDGRGTHEMRVMPYFDNAPVHNTGVSREFGEFWIQKNGTSALSPRFSTMWLLSFRCN
jgi:hypothetical protein